MQLIEMFNAEEQDSYEGLNDYQEAQEEDEMLNDLNLDIEMAE
jgi:hypothetical protein